MAVFGLGAFGFFVGPALLDFFAFEGDFAFVATETEAAVLETAAFLSADDFFDFPPVAVAVTAFLSVPAFLVLGEEDAPFFAPLDVDTFGLSVATAVARFTPDFLVFDAEATGFFFSAVGLPAPVEAEANLNDPEAPLPFVCTNAPVATDAFRYFLMKGATFSASTL